MPISEYKICVFGSGGVGKSCLTMQFVQGIFMHRYDPTIEDVYKKTVEIDGKQYSLEILDTAGTEEFSAMRDLYVKNSHGFVLVYSITSQATFNDLEEFYERIRHATDMENQNQLPLILVGNKIDLEDDRVVGRQAGQELARRWRCTFLEASAKNQSNVNEIFFELVRLISRMTPKGGVGGGAGASRRHPARPNYPPNNGRQASSAKRSKKLKCVLM